MKGLLRKVFYALPISWRIRIKKEISLLYYQAGYGDTFMVGAVAREIKKRYGDVTITINGAKKELLSHNPYVNKTGQRYNGIDLNYHHGKINVGKNFEKNILDVMCDKVCIKNPVHHVDIFLSDDENEYARSEIEHLGYPVITIHTTPGIFDNGRKSWPFEYWEKLITMLTNEKCSVIQLGAVGEKHINGTINLTGKQDIRRSIAIIKAANLHIGVVSSLMHGANAVDTPAIILFGGFERYSLHGYKNIHPIESYIPCSPCIEAETTIEKCPLNNKCMREITPEIVFNKTVEVLTWK